MSTPTASHQDERRRRRHVATSARFKTFAVTFAIAGTVIYLLCLQFNWPLFTFHPAVSRFEWGWGPSRSGEGPAMYWYGWTATTIIAGAVVSFLATPASRKHDQEDPADPGLAAPDPGDSAISSTICGLVVPPVGRRRIGARHCRMRRTRAMR